MSTKIEQAVMKNFTKALSGSVKTGMAKIDEAIAVSTKFKSLQDVINNMVADCAKANSAENFMSDYCGITNQNEIKNADGTTTYKQYPYVNPKNDETVQNKWSKDWGSYLYDDNPYQNSETARWSKDNGVYLYDDETYKRLLPQNDSEVSTTDTTFEKNGLSVNVVLNDKISDKSPITNQNKIVTGAYSWWIEDAVKLVEDTYNVDFNGQKIDLIFKYDDSEDSAGATTVFSNNGIRYETPKLSINMAANEVARITQTYVATDSTVSKAYGPYFEPSLIAHEMAHVAQFYFNMPDYTSEGTPAYIDEGMGDLTVGRFYVEDINALAGNADSLKTALNNYGKNVSITVNEGTDEEKTYKKLEYETGFLFWHYLMKQTADSADAAGTDYTTNYSKLSFNGTEGADVGYAGYVNFGNGSNYALGSGDDTLYVYGNNVSVDGGADNDRIENHSANVTITGGTGADTIDMGDKWHNVFNYANGDGNDTVYNFHENDQMSISGAAHSTIASGTDVIVSVGDGQVVLNGANGKSLNIVNSYQSTETVTPEPTPTPDPATTETVQPATTDTVQPAREYAYTYNSGNMTISDYQSWENIKFNGTYSNWAVDGNDFVVNAAEGSLRVSDAKGKMIELYDGNDDLMMHAVMQNAGDYFAGTIYDEEGNITDGTYYEKVVVIGASNGDNTIAAGAGGSELWGNAGVNRLIGGEGEDTFIYNSGEGAGFIEAGTEDTIKFSDVTFDQIRKIKFDADRTLFVFDNFNILNVTGRPENFIIGGQNYRADYNAKRLQEVHTN